MNWTAFAILAMFLSGKIILSGKIRVCNMIHRYTIYNYQRKSGGTGYDYKARFVNFNAVQLFGART